MEARQVDELAERVLAAGDAARQIEPLSYLTPDLDLAAAYQVARRVRELREEGGERASGWKIGFTNSRIWDEYGVHAPIWAPVYDSTVAPALPGVPDFIGLDRLCEPQIEPEIAFRFGRTPEPDMDEEALLGCVDGVAHGFEIVHSVFPGWRFTAPDCVAAFGLHGLFHHGPFVPVEASAGWRRRLEDFAVRLYRNGELVDRGHAQNVLGGPLKALRHMLEGMQELDTGRGVLAGDIVTTGTVTRAFRVKAGETWRSEIDGLPVPGLTVSFETAATRNKQHEDQDRPRGRERTSP